MKMIEVSHKDNGESIKICECDAEYMASIGWTAVEASIKDAEVDIEVEEID